MSALSSNSFFLTGIALMAAGTFNKEQTPIAEWVVGKME
jgi:hypothetical protein